MSKMLIRALVIFVLLFGGWVRPAQSGSLPEPAAQQGQTTVRVYADSSDSEVINQNCTTFENCQIVSWGDGAFNGIPNGTILASYDPGQYGPYLVKRVFQLFDTTGIPANAEITAASLNLYAENIQVGSNKIHVVRSDAKFPPTYQEFGDFYWISGGSANFPVNRWSAIPLNQTALGWIEKGGLTKFALLHDYDMTETNPVSRNEIVIDMAESSRPPYLEITYIGADSGFRPDPNGFQFQNTTTDVTWEMFEQFYGRNNVRKPNNDKCEAAKAFFEGEDYRLLAGMYSCFGFSIASLLNYYQSPQESAGPFAVPYFERLYDQPSSSQLLNSIAYYQRTWSSKAWHAMYYEQHAACQSDPQSPVDRIERGIEENNPYILNLFLPGKGHALVPYRVENISPTEADVYVYDSERPGEERKVHFTFVEQGWKWAYTFVGSLGDYGPRTGFCTDLKLYPLSLASQNAENHLPFNACNTSPVPSDAVLNAQASQRILANLPAVGDWLITDRNGNRLGWNGEQAAAEIPDAFEMLQLSSEIIKRTYTLPADRYVITGNNVPNRASDFILFADGHFFSAQNLLDAPGTSPRMTVQADLTNVVVDQLQNVTSMDLTFDTELPDSSRLAAVSASEISGSEALTTEFNGDEFMLSRRNGTLQYSIAFRRSGSAAQFFHTQPLTLNANERHTLRPGSWANLPETTILLEIDRGMDGTVDEIRILTNTSKLLYIPTILK